MDVSLKKANEHRNAWFEGVQKCNLNDTLFTVMEKIVRAEVHRLVVVNEEEKVIGIISLSDILLYLVLRPSGDGLGDSESLRATDPIMLTRERAESNTSLMYNRSNESIEEETNNDLEKEFSHKEDEVIEAKTDDNLTDNANNNIGEKSPPLVSPTKSLDEAQEECEDKEDEEDELVLDNDGNNNINNTLNIQREVVVSD